MKEFTRSPLGYRISLTALLQTLVVAEHLNFRHAANTLGVSQSAISARIKALEDELGVILFERRHRGVRLTEAGHRFVEEVAAGIDHLDKAVRTAGAISSGTEGRLAIGLQASIAFGFLSNLRCRFRRAYPKIEQAIREGRSSETIALVREGKLDIAFVAGSFDAPDCHSRELWQEPLVIVLPAEHPLAPRPSIAWADLVAETFLVRDGGSGPQVFDHVVRRVVEQERSPHIQRFDVGGDTLIHMVAAGDGITLTSEATTHVPFPGVVFRPIAGETEQARFSAVWSPHNHSVALKNLLNLAVNMSRSVHSV
ncbi:MAG: LysR family transcriptional regulator [Alphaproteobacteria bacterium]|nr:LysR family transcriptional regulator [Alphaproteobacteria bacterium]MBU2229985.1 LysR family transcriptional regulator [Alphaproteobacteria bacterium]